MAICAERRIHVLIRLRNRRRLLALGDERDNSDHGPHKNDPGFQCCDACTAMILSRESRESISQGYFGIGVISTISQH
jgi:hypothetical protein